MRIPRASERSETGPADIRDEILRNISERSFVAVIWSRQDGVVAGIDRLRDGAKEIGLSCEMFARDGDEVRAGGVIAVVEGTPKQIALAEDSLIGLIAKTSGIATAARRAVILSSGKTKVVSGGWKKMPKQIKEEIREAIKIGGAGIRITEEPFVYLDKNYVRMFGSITEAIRSVPSFKDRTKVVQIRGDTGDISDEAVEAAEEGAGIIMVDTGSAADLVSVSDSLKREGLRNKIRIAFGGSILIENIPRLLEMDVDIFDIGRAIIDAPMLDIRFDVKLAEP